MFSNHRAWNSLYTYNYMNLGTSVGGGYVSKYWIHLMHISRKIFIILDIFLSVSMINGVYYVG